MSTTPVPAPTGLRMPRREVEVDLPPEYPGMKVTLWTNYPRRIQEQLRSGDADQLKAALKTIVLAHNGWGDEEGNPLPPPSEDSFWDAISDELAACVLALLNLESAKLPNSLLARKAN